ncbi:hypothetical protein [Fimbriiglobus ruber]|uniref:Uncharacterized protein n=1 Tax=Fimbriiglobus ruber TaxID=1908690 RepID=A0A225DZ97_9BACT|nr:hypothetical protein [Fimbriiglobus ruber]OWK41675.1 hypothetical protein FRUB_03753 [Fimbriiglobus ruber]
MSTVPPVPPETSVAPPAPLHPSSSAVLPLASTGGKAREIKVISHSTLFYWWPVWVLAFLMAGVTLVENHRLAILPAGTTVAAESDPPAGGAVYRIQVPRKPSDAESGARTSLLRAKNTTENNASYNAKDPVFPIRMSQQSWPGAVFVIGLIMTIMITNVTLRGLWSFISIALVLVLVLTISLFKVWEHIFDALGDLHIHINMAGYLFIGVCVFVLWAVATFIFDQRTYVIFTPGQIRVCEHIGAAVQAYPTMNVTLEKQRDDLFRHYILGFGSGDLILRISSGGDKREIKLPNVMWIGSRQREIEDMLRSMMTTTAA